MRLSDILLRWGVHSSKLTECERNLLLDLMERGVEDTEDLPVRTAVITDDIYEIYLDELSNIHELNCGDTGEYITGSKLNLCRHINNLLDRTFKEKPVFKAGTVVVKYYDNDEFWYVDEQYTKNLPVGWEPELPVEWVTKYLMQGKEINKEASNLFKRLGV